ncbi:polyadenylation factor subunit 2 [Rhizoctonia solani]|uniref:Polyadenylation factor subunit 2 n=1 Tax=Rhizoctonia solani TaxID=456999 RepID=A0A8H8P4D7_9AGAM|nr:polyadenylation factor subunit 2 [Rhizoctonia solani]QRW25441.1 polyadenylation factor subunit 2 [Rhizoctonia solani]
MAPCPPRSLGLWGRRGLHLFLDTIVIYSECTAGYNGSSTRIKRLGSRVPPLGHILCTGSNDHTTRFWCRDRPGEGLSGTATSAMEESTEDDGYDALPGFGMASSGMNMTGQDGGQGGMEWEVGNVRPGTGAWGTQGGDEFIPGFGKSTLPASNDNGGSGSGRAPPPPGFGMDDVYDNRGGGGRGGYGDRDYSGHQRGGRGDGRRGGRGGRRWD